jgi:catechol-2,3-dioxygenase
MPVNGFSHYNLRGDRATVERLREFYVDVIGLEVGERPPITSFGYWLYAGGAAVLHLSEARSSDPPIAGAGSFDHAAFACADLAGFEERLRRREVAFRKMQVAGTGVIQLFCRDPAGNGVELSFATEGA